MQDGLSPPPAPGPALHHPRAEQHGGVGELGAHRYHGVHGLCVRGLGPDLKNRAGTAGEHFGRLGNIFDQNPRFFVKFLSLSEITYF